ncbi:hypothetical protein WA026_010891 [Henosepilachna vigintioctopunctata]|uniref:CRAL-TRIO domain-containing protein n=1 Tax=Henosepilachna vigintioctopunctata TaxID=420089 RepID=A0AAW1UX27_9CUCU
MSCSNAVKNIAKYESDCLHKLKILLENDVDLNDEISTEDGILMKFLYSRRLSIGSTYTLIKNYVKYREENPRIFDNLTIHDEEIRKALENSLPELLPQKDRQCRTIIVFHANNWDGTYSLYSIYRALLLCLEFALQNVHVQNNGFVIIVNWDQFFFNKMPWLSPRIINTIIYGLQECYPARFLELHFLAPKWYINTAFNIFKMSFSEEMKENFYVHNRNLSSLHDFIHKDVLPTDLGGSLPSYNCAKLIEDLEKYCGTSK